MMQGDGRRRRNENYFDDIPRSKLERQMAQSKYDFQTGDWGEPSISLRAPNETTGSMPFQYWQHHPEKLIFQACDYKAYSMPFGGKYGPILKPVAHPQCSWSEMIKYLGSMLIKELRGTESTQDACSKMRVCLP
uniref:Uncharacterized protein n=1 Tax=Leptobrachium leishanense TaxID=445787 RepID=A0A8C5QKL5_9ANUR